MERNLLYNKKGLSAIVITVILIALSMAAIVLVWVFVNNMIKGQIKSSESCFGNFDKVSINEQYTCYDAAAQSIRFSLIVGDIDVDKIIVSVSSASAVKSYEITNTAGAVTGLLMYPSGSTNIVLPGKNAGLTYRATGFTSTADLIQIAPVIGGTQCETSDSVSEIEPCIG
jgi:hypothetical protein